MGHRVTLCFLILGLVSPPCSRAQDPTGMIEGEVLDQSGSAIPGASVRATHLRTNFAHRQTSGPNGTFSFAFLPIGEYDLVVEAPNFASYRRGPMTLNINQRIRLSVELELATTRQSVDVRADAPLVDTGTNVLGTVVTEREILDLPLNGRNFTQLGLLQAGVAPLTAGIATAGGSLRAGQAFSVNGQRPESNNYLLDGTKIVNRADGGYAFNIPVDAITEFRILTHTPPAEYGTTSGGTTSVVSRSGGNEIQGTLYEFIRNDKLDARNFFSRDVEPLKQNQFGGTLGGPLRRDRAFFFGYYEGFRNRQGITKTATVPTPQQRVGDFSGQPAPLVNFLTGEPFPDNMIPPDMLHPISLRVLDFYPLGNTSPSLFTTTEVMKNNADQAGVRLDHALSEKDSLSARYSYAARSNVNPLSIRGADVPGFPVADELRTQSLTISETHQFTERTLNSFRAGFLRHRFLFDKRLNTMSPRELGFNYDTTLDVAKSAPFFIVSGYASVGGAITGPRNTVQNTFELYDTIVHTRGSHTVKLGAEFRRNQINVLQGIASNGFFVFAPFPASDPFASFLMGMPVVFFQAGGDLGRGLRNWDLAAYAQDEWGVARTFTLNLGVRYEIITPFGEVRKRLNAFAPGQQSVVRPDAPAGLLFPGDPGVGDRVAEIYTRAWMPRVGLAWDPTGTGRLSVRAGYGIYFDGLTNGMGGPLQAAISAIPWTQARQVPGPFLNYAEPLAGQPGAFDTTSIPAPMTILTVEQGLRPAYAQDWNLSIQRALGGSHLIEIRYVGTKGTRLPRFVEANPAVFGPGATAQNADRRRIHAGCSDPALPCDFASVGLLTSSTSSTYHAGQMSLSRRFSAGFGFLISYTLSKTLDYVSSLNLSGSAPRLLSGENDVAQNPFDLSAEHGPSLFDSRHRLAVSSSYKLPFFRNARGFTRTLLAGWQLNGIATLYSSMPFTVYDSTNVSLQGSHPQISGFFSSRPDLVGDPNQGPRRPEQWLGREAFRRLDPVAEAGQFGNAGRNIARGPGFGNLDLSLIKSFPLGESRQLQFRVEGFNLTNRPNFALPVNDLASPNFGRVLEAGPPRLMQFALKLLF